MEAIRRPELTWTGLEDLLPDLEAFLLRFSRDRIEIEDVVQEALMRAARYRGSLSESSSLRPWVMQIALNVMRDRARRELRLPRVEADDELFDAIEGREEIPGETPDDLRVVLSGAVVEKRAAVMHLRHALHDLEREERTVLGAWYAEGLDCDRAATVCECGPELVRVRAWRARRRLTRFLCARLALDDTIEWPTRGRAGPSLQELLGAQCTQARKAVKRSAQSAAG